ncbi:ABC transporter [Pilobolus umbonatus]|nr:ABC transporter [Pilobolus umbonatus]
MSPLSPIQSSLTLFNTTPPPDCPPCFNCMLPGFECLHFANCSEYNGKCSCPPGYGGDDCKQPLCGALSDGEERLPRENDHCDCPEGWEGINCNVCKTDNVCDSLVPTGQNGTCYRGGLTVVENYQICNVTNRKILDQLKTQIPQVTFSCNREHETCDFQFWVDEVESFYCHLDTCDFSEKHEYNKNSTLYNCENIECRCIKDEFLCGKDGSIDLTDFLTEDLEGPASFDCVEGKCAFSEPAMDDLISAVFGDDSIYLSCNSGECLHYTMVPGFTRPEKQTNWTMIISGLSGVSVFLIVVAAVFTSYSRDTAGAGTIKIGDDEAGKLMNGHTPTSLIFDNISYDISTRNTKKVILDSASGMVQPGQVMAIMGPSGAGKTTLLDILARRTKSGNVSGNIYLNGQEVSARHYKKLVGYVDQEEVMIPTLTVYETILYSALLRLPRNMSKKAKQFRVMEVMQELGIDNIKDAKIGQPGSRSISGGERRRVAIACELVTSPSILFLDEPTTGLDAYNAFNVVESLVALARDYKRTVIFTIHQPRSNIVTLFDQLLLVASGRVIYSGPQSECQNYFRQIGYPCPPGFNIADFMIDLTMGVVPRRTPLATDVTDDLFAPEPSTTADTFYQDDLENTTQQWAAELARENRSSGNVDGNNSDTTVRSIGGPKVMVDEASTDGLSSHIRQLLEYYQHSLIASALRENIQSALTTDTNENDESSSQSSVKAITVYERAGLMTQFAILANRTFKNLYRNPMLMFSHYAMAVLLALICGGLFYQVSNTIAGFQNRMGLFFFYEALLAFMCLTSLQVFSNERILFARERANGYYSPTTYFLSKVLFDIIPLRVVPPLMMVLISYSMIGLVEGVQEFFKFLLVLILFNLTAAALCLAIGVVVKNLSLANLIACMLILFSMLFAGLLLNKDSMSPYFSWLKYLSFFNYALEAMLVNELLYLQLVEERYGLNIDVPGATILSTFGFNAKNYWPDVIRLSSMFVLFITIAYVWLVLFVKERR